MGVKIGVVNSGVRLAKIFVFSIVFDVLCYTVFLWEFSACESVLNLKSTIREKKEENAITRCLIFTCVSHTKEIYSE